jgi:outer membrane cobalamin receptor
VNDGITLYAHAAVGQVDAPPGAVSEEDVDLDTETRTLLDAGVRLADERLGSVSAGLFGASRDRAVVLDSTRVTDDGDTFNIYVNKDIRQYGLELEARSTRIANILRLLCSVTIMESEQDDDGRWREYREIPNQVGECGVLVDVGRFDLSIFGKYVGAYENKRFAEDGEYHPLGDFVDLNVTAGVTLNRERGTRVYVSLENVLDDEYSTVVGYPDYGFQAFAGIRSEF